MQREHAGKELKEQGSSTFSIIAKIAQFTCTDGIYTFHAALLGYQHQSLVLLSNPENE